MKAIPCLALILLCSTVALGQTDAPAKPDKAALARLWQEAEVNYQEKKWDAAIAKYKELLQMLPQHGNALAHMAFSNAMLGKTQEAVADLKQALDAGWVFFAQLEHDPQLQPFVKEKAVQELLAKKDEYLQANVVNRMALYAKQMGPAYAVQRDDPYRLIFVSNLPPNVLAKLTGMLHAFGDALGADLFTHKPEVYIALLIPGTPDDLSKMGLRPGSAGTYNPANRSLLINLGTGPGTMTHEFTHSLHFADMELRGEAHPMWVIEGFGSLYEQCQLKDGHVIGLPNWRLIQLKAMIAQKKTLRLEKFLSDSNAEFVRNAPAAYATARYVMLFLQERGLLRTWYAQYCKDYENDKTGVKTLERLYGKPLAEFETDFYAWVDTLQFTPPPMPTPPAPPKPPAADNSAG